MTTDRLFAPLHIGSIVVNGRIYKTATSETRADINGYVTDELLAFYKPLLRAGTPLIITGNLYISALGKSTHRMCGADHDDKIPGLTRWAELAHRHNSKIIAQINHCGRQTLPHTVNIKQAVSASNVTEKFLGTKPRPLQLSEIQDIISDFANAALRCKKAGMDGVQIHVGHGYLLNQFLTPYTNRRTDQYGGNEKNRSRLLLEVYRAIREKVGNEYPVIIKINGADALPIRKGLKTSALIKIAKQLEKEGLDGVEITVGHYESGFPMIHGYFNKFFSGMLKEGLGKQLPILRRLMVTLFSPFITFGANKLWPTQEGFNLKYARQFKQALDIPVICVGGFHTRSAMESAIASNQVDAVSCARAMIADPYLVKHIRENQQGPQCDFCNACIARAGSLPVDCYHEVIGIEKAALLERMENRSTQSISIKTHSTPIKPSSVQENVS